MTLATSSGKHKITSIFNERLNRLFVTVCHWLSLSVTIEVVVILPDRASLRYREYQTVTSPTSSN
ncbi:hypothetical protein FJO85_05145 [Shigella flexneri]|uniref:hypothetical protein n=1 Tax=Shigella TaxID=620 RepID=UPI00042A1682|nr:MULTISPECIES: hypothetical protein [Shigella]EFW2722346.1 hypothetical protein [Shigella sonnei]EFW0377244.1 hypothetical protein [Shigella flexneri]EFW2117912.1 hypothetical protein [Shigella flexneri]EFW2661658.1 hypothetical protein [Shigella flexneri]EFW3860930.1 hypothetical protein [Shigella flexneri]